MTSRVQIQKMFHGSEADLLVEMWRNPAYPGHRRIASLTVAIGQMEFAVKQTKERLAALNPPCFSRRDHVNV